MEVRALVSGEQPPEVSLQYKDYTEWQNSEKQIRAIKKQEDYWLKTFEGELPILHLPFDYPRPAVQSIKGSLVNFFISKEQTRIIKEMAKSFDTTLFIMLLAAYNILLSRLSGQQDIVVGVPIAGRRHWDLQHAIGMFVNTLPIRNYPSQAMHFPDFLQEVKQTTTAAYENQDYQFEDLVEKLKINRDTGRNPVFDVVFNSVSLLESGGELPESETDSNYDHQPTNSRFDLTFTLIEVGGGLSFSSEYCTRLFKPATIERFIGYFKKILSHLLENPDITLGEIDILSEKEKIRLLNEFNQTESAYPGDKTIHELFAEQAEKRIDSVAVIDLERGVTPPTIKGAQNPAQLQITYHELNKRSNQLAHQLRCKGVGPDTVVALMVKRSLEMIVGIIGILKAGGAYLPIDTDYPRERIDYMLKDSNAKVLLSEVSELSEVSKGTETINLHSLIAENEDAEPTHLTHPTHPTQLCYVIYTSGSTGRPKGVGVEHRSLVNALTWQSHFYNITERDHTTQYASPAFDASLLEIFPCLLQGASLYIIDGETRLDPEKLNRYFEKHGITLGFLPTQLCEQFMELENRSLRVLLAAGDKLRHFKQREYQLYNNYGPTENTVVTTAFPVNGQYDNIPIGKPVFNTRIYILSPVDLHLQPIGVVGELCIAGDGLARGYLNNPELTAEKFVDYRSYMSYRTYSSKKIYKTGDLARWLADGNIEFIGRIDHQVKIRGFRIELGEIESHLLAHEDIKEALVLSRGDESGDNYLCAYAVLADDAGGEKTVSIGEKLRTYLSRSLPDYMIPSYFVVLNEIPLTFNGKVHRKALPTPQRTSAASFVPPRSLLEIKIAEIWSDILEIEKKHIGIENNFFQLGGHSLLAVTLVSQIHKVLNVRIPITEIFRLPTIRDLAEFIKNSRQDDRFASIERVEKKEYYLQSPAQKRLYLQHHMQKNNLSYNMPHVFMLEGNLNKERFEETFHKLIRRHENLRTSFEMIKEQPIQKIHQCVDFVVEYEEGNEDEVNRLLHTFLKPFDLDKVPLLRVKLAAIGEARTVLICDMHHIIMDGTAMRILMREFMVLYAGEELPPLRIQYKDFSQWQHREMKTGEIKRQEEYWLKEFAGDAPVLNLPADYKRPEMMLGGGGAAGFEIGVQHTGRLKQMALQEGTTLYMVLLAIFNILLSRVCDQDDILVGVPTAGRSHTDLQSIIGFFINMLAVRNLPGGEKTFRDFLQEVKSKTLNAYENQDYQFENLVEKILADRDSGRNSLVDVIFVFQNMSVMGGDLPEVTIPGLTLKPYKQDITFSPFDLLLNGGEAGEVISLTFQYRNDLFKKSTIQVMIRIFNEIISSVLQDKNIRLKDIRVSYDLMAVTQDHLEEIEGELDFFDE
jgi:amino acid adenylation domain-containing protein